MAYNAYQAARLSGQNKMENLEPGEFVPKWEATEVEEEPEVDIPVAPEQSGLLTRVLGAFGSIGMKPGKKG